MITEEKAALRRAIRAGYPGAETRARESEALCRHVMNWEAYRQARCVAGYLPLKREADVTPILRDCLQQGKQLLLPRVEGEGVMTLRLVRALEELQPGSFGILEPSPDAPVVSPHTADLILVPLEGIDRSGMRLGKGGGYYDRLLQTYRGVTLGIAMSWQWMASIPCEAWDMPLDAAADAEGVHQFLPKPGQ